MGKFIYREYDISCDTEGCCVCLHDCDVWVLNSDEIRKREAKKVGFKKIKGKWYCPTCMKMIGGI